MKLTLSSLLLLLSLAVSAQKYLYIKHNNQPPADRIGLHERVVFKTAESRTFTKGLLDDITPGSITVDGRTYPLASIESFRTRNELMTIGGTAMMAGSLMFTALAVINRTGLSGNFTQREALGLGAVFGGGLLLRWAGRRTFKKEKGWKWEVIDLDSNE